ncbi:hypothetical protein [Microcystis phage MaeS]|nr:hypothetical protein [Microcystis phage MaeS]
MANYPDFKSGFKYQNIGNIVGTLNYAREMKKKDGVSVFGWEFLINAKGYGSINVKIPIMAKAQNSMDNYPVSDKPRVRAGLSRIEQFFADNGKIYTNATTFVELADAITVNGDPMADNIAGRVAGEVFNIQQIQGQNAPAIKFFIVTYPLDRDDESKRAFNGDGTPVEPQVLVMEVHDPQLVQQFQQQVQNGANIEVGYRYLNKSNVTYDEFGYAQNDSNSVIERIEVGKLLVHGAAAPQGNGGFGGANPFGGQQPQGNPFNQTQGQQQGNPFGQQPNNQGYQGGGFGDPNQYTMPDNQIPFNNNFGQPNNDPFANGQQLPQNDPFAQQAGQFFNQGNPQGSPFGFGN